MPIEATESSLRSRVHDISRLLRPLSRHQHGPACHPRVGPTHYVIGTYDGSRPTGDYTEWRFRTPVTNLRGMYYERWLRADASGKTYLMERSYLHLIRLLPSRLDEEEMICLHCDPIEPETEPHSRYKRGPHLHFIMAEEPIPHAHIALNMGYLDSILESTSSLHDAIGIAVQMLRDEILEPLLP